MSAVSPALSVIVRALAMSACLAACAGQAPPVPIAPVGIPVAKAAAAPVAPVAPPDILFLRRAPAVGDRYDVQVRASSSYEQPQGDFLGDEYRCDYSALVLPTQGTVGHRLQITFARHQRSTADAQSAIYTKPSPLDGKTFIIDAAGPSVNDEHGVPASADAFDAAARVFSDLGVREQIALSLPDLPMPLGVEVPGLAEGVFQVLNAKSWTPTQSRAQLKEVTTDRATFELQLKAASASGLTLDLGGTALVLRADRTLSELHLSGPFRGPPPDRAPGHVSIHRFAAVVPASQARPGGTSPSPSP
jgi:hypothetical protein